MYILVYFQFLLVLYISPAAGHIVFYHTLSQKWYDHFWRAMACKVRKTLLITTPILSRGTPELIKKVSFDLKAQRCNASYAKKYKRAPIVTDRYRTIHIGNIWIWIFYSSLMITRTTQTCLPGTPPCYNMHKQGDSWRVGLEGAHPTTTTSIFGLPWNLAKWTGFFSVVSPIWP